MTACASLALLGSIAAAEIPLDQRRSGYDTMSPATKAMIDKIRALAGTA